MKNNNSIDELRIETLAKCNMSILSKSRPPKCLSQPVPSTRSLPFTKDTTATCMAVSPMSTKHTFLAVSTGMGRRMPYCSAMAVVSFIRRSTFRPATLAASIMALRSMPVQYVGQDTTQSVTRWFSRPAEEGQKGSRVGLVESMEEKSILPNKRREKERINVPLSAIFLHSPSMAAAICCGSKTSFFPS